MNWDQMEGKWKQLAGSVRERWGKFTHKDFQTIAGRKEKRDGQIQERHGIARAETEKRAERWTRSLDKLMREGNDGSRR